MRHQILRAVLAVALLGTVPATAAGTPPVMQLNGEPYFPIGWYLGYAPTSVADATAYLAPMRHQGMNTGLTCYYSWRGERLAISARMLEGAAANDMTMMVETMRRCAVLSEPGCPLSEIDDQVDALMSYPALLGWYMIDQPEYKDIEPEDLIPIYERIKNRDTVGHAIFIEFGSWDTHRPEAEWLAVGRMSDALMTNIYPCRDTDSEFGGKLWRPAVTARHGTDTAITYEQEAYINVVQAHQWSSGLRLPTFPEQRYISYAPIVEGARGLYYWMYENAASEGQRTIVIPRIVHEIQSLVPAIISNSTAVSVTSDGDTDTTGHDIEDVTYLFGADERRGHLIAVNNTPDELAVTFQLSGGILANVLGPESQDIPVLFEQRNVQVEPTGDPSVRTLTDNFSPFDVNVYLIYDTPNDAAPTGLPDKATHPHPADQATSVGRSFDLSWASPEEATSYDVYFGTTNPPPFQGNQTASVYDPGTMPYGTPHFWRIDTVNSYGTTTGDVWTFTTTERYLPEQAGDPYPENLAVDVNRSDELSWAIAPAARSYDAYFGTANPPPFRGNQTKVVFDTGTMEADTTYYWRIDPVNDDGTTTGQVWTFTTGQVIGAAELIDPEPGTTLTSADTTFSWTEGTDLVAYWLYIGSSKGESDLFSDDIWGRTYVHVTDLPTDGRTLYVRLRSRTSTEWRWFNDYTYTAATIILPDQATDPGPEDQATKIWPGAELRWSPAENADSYDVCFGTTDPPAFQGNQTQTTFDPGGMSPTTLYYWRVDSVNSDGTTTGDTWTFATRGWETYVDLGTTDDEQGLSRVDIASGHTEAVTIGGRECRKNKDPDDPGNDWYMYFAVDDYFACEGNKPDLYIAFDYYDTGAGTIWVSYDSSDPDGWPTAMYKSVSTLITGTDTWKQHFFHVTDAYFGNRQNGGADFRFWRMDDTGEWRISYYLDVVEVREESPLPSQAADASPPHLATKVSTTAEMSWAPAEDATSYDVYFGPARPPAFQGNQAETTFDPGTMGRLTPYFWRVDTVNGFGVTPGEEWSFTTESCPGDSDSDGDVDQEDFGFFQACYSGSAVSYEPECENSDLDGDLDVDLDDLGIFQTCMNGANHLPGC